MKRFISLRSVTVTDICISILYDMVIRHQYKFVDNVALASTDDNHQFFYNTIITYRTDNWKHITMKGTANTLSVVRAAPGATK